MKWNRTFNRLSCRNITFLLFLLLCPVLVMAQNLVQNGSFTTQPSAPWVFAPPGNSVEAYLSEISYGGTAGTNIVAEIDQAASLRQTNIPVVAGQTYYFSYRYTRRTGNGAAPNPSNINVKIYDGTNTFLSRNEVANNINWQWTCVVDSFIPTTNVVAIDIVSTNLSVTLGVIVDDLTITPMQQPVTLTGQTCAGGTLTLNAPVSDPNTQYSNYQWTGPNGFTATGATVTLTNVQVSQSGAYTCTMDMNTSCLHVSGTYLLSVLPNEFTINRTICNGETYNFYGRTLFAQGTYDTLISSSGLVCDSNITLNLSVNPLPDMTATPGGATSICAGDSLFLKLNNPGSNTSYQWYKDGALLNGETGSAYRAQDAGTYYAVGVQNGCNDTSHKIALTVNPLPEGEIKLWDSEIKCSYDTLTLSVEGSAGYTYIWYPSQPFLAFSGTESSTVKGVFPRLQTTVGVYIFNEFGCQATDSILVQTKPCCETFVPNAFSPNGDGRNDRWLPQLKPGQVLLAMSIYDRWGNPVYDNTFSKTGWDGTVNGKEAGAGVYMYYLKYTCSDQRNYEKKGDMVLIR